MNPDTGTERTDFLGRVRAALAGGRPESASPTTSDSPGVWAARAREIRAEASRRWEELLPRFKAEVEAVAGVMYRAEAVAVPRLISQIAKERRLVRVATWSEAALELPGLIAALRGEGLEVEDGSESPDDSGRADTVEAARARLNRAEVGVTGVDWAVADSGSLILLSGPGKGRLVSCLPSIHVAILRPGQLVESMAEVGIWLEDLHRQRPPGESPSSITFITGPSRTADIELSLTRGVHGPKEVHVIALS